MEQMEQMEQNKQFRDLKQLQSFPVEKFDTLLSVLGEVCGFGKCNGKFQIFSSLYK